MIIFRSQARVGNDFIKYFSVMSNINLQKQQRAITKISENSIRHLCSTTNSYLTVDLLFLMGQWFTVTTKRGNMGNVFHRSGIETVSKF